MFMRGPRKLKNFLISPKVQLKYSLYFVASSLAIVGTMIVMIYAKMEKIQRAISEITPVQFAVQELVNRTILEIILVTVLIFIFFALVVFAYSIIISHRIAGPVLAIERYIQEIKAGNYEPGRPLRKYDELQPIMTALQDLALTLKSKSDKNH